MKKITLYDWLFLGIVAVFVVLLFFAISDARKGNEIEKTTTCSNLLDKMRECKELIFRGGVECEEQAIRQAELCKLINVVDDDDGI